MKDYTKCNLSSICKRKSLDFGKLINTSITFISCKYYLLHLTVFFCRTEIVICRMILFSNKVLNRYWTLLDYTCIGLSNLKRGLTCFIRNCISFQLLSGWLLVGLLFLSSDVPRSLNRLLYLSFIFIFYFSYQICFPPISL